MHLPLPQILLNELQSVQGFDENAFAAAHLQRAVTSVRLHPLKQSNAFADFEQVPWCPTGRYLSERPIFTLDPLHHAGAYYVQEASSMFLDVLLRQVIADNKNLRVLDLCAAPGGKSTLISSLLDADSLLVSNEVIRTRASILDENTTRWGYTNAWVTSNDPQAFAKLTGYFDIIVVDAPCSGSGLFRKDEKALGEWSENNVQLCSGRQQRILADIWPALKEDGILIYATCSYSPQEDEQILDWLATEFTTESISVAIPSAWGIIPVSSPENKMAGYRFFPDKVKGEGFFIAAIQKKESASSIKQPRFKSLNDKKIQQQAAHLLKNGDYSFLQTGNDGYNAIHSKHEMDFQMLKEAVYLRKTGLPLGMPTAKEWLPSHEVAMSVDIANSLPAISVNKEQALKFLKKEDINFASADKGWSLIQFEGLNLGWIKNLGNRANNYLPKHWRIRMDIEDRDGA